MITMSEKFLCLCVFIPGKCQNVTALVPAMSLGRSVGPTLPDWTHIKKHMLISKSTRSTIEKL